MIDLKSLREQCLKSLTALFYLNIICYCVYKAVDDTFIKSLPIYFLAYFNTNDCS